MHSHKDKPPPTHGYRMLLRRGMLPLRGSLFGAVLGGWPVALVLPLAVILVALVLIVANSFHSRNGTMLGGGLLFKGLSETLSEDSVRMRVAFPMWLEAHDKYVQEIDAALEDGGLDVVWYGDSITESFRESNLGKPCFAGRCDGIAEVWKERFASRFRAGAFAIGGDTTAHLLWRLQHGELPDGLEPKLFIVLIGTNDLTRIEFNENDELDDSAGPHVAQNVVEVTNHIIRSRPSAHLLLLAMLPRGDRGQPGEAMFAQPSKFTASIDAANARIKAWAQAKSDRVTYLDCNAAMLEGSGGERAIKPDLMPDALHPNAAGMKLLADCLEPHLLRRLPLARVAAGGGNVTAAAIEAQTSPGLDNTTAQFSSKTGR